MQPVLTIACNELDGENSVAATCHNLDVCFLLLDDLEYLWISPNAMYDNSLWRDPLENTFST
eukprot:923067-Karenia_brevis.AAC.1